MALKLADRIKENSNTTGTGPFHMNGAVAGFQTAASALADGDQAYFAATDNASTWVVFLGTFTLAGNLVTVNTVLASSPGYAGFTAAPTIWIDAPAALLSKVLPVMPSNDFLVGGALAQTLSNKYHSDYLAAGDDPTFISNLLNVTKAQNTNTIAAFRNNNTGTAASVQIQLQNNASIFQIGMWGTGYTPSGNFLADEATIYVSGANAGGLMLGTNAAQPVKIVVGGAERARFLATGQFQIGGVNNINNGAGNPVDVMTNFNGNMAIKITNLNAGNAAGATFYSQNNISHNMMLQFNGNGIASGGLLKPDGVTLWTDGSNGLTLGTNAASPIYFVLNGGVVGSFSPYGAGAGSGFLNVDAQYSNVHSLQLRNSTYSSQSFRFGVASGASSNINGDALHDCNIWGTNGAGSINFSLDGGNTMAFQIRQPGGYLFAHGGYGGGATTFNNSTHVFCNNIAQQAITGQSMAATPYGIAMAFSVTPNNTGSDFLQMLDTYPGTGVNRFNVKSNGGVYNYSANNVNLSDARAKTDIEEIDETLGRQLWAAYQKVDWGRFKYADQTHDDHNWGYTAQGVAKAFKGIADALVTPWQEEDGPLTKASDMLGVYEHDLLNIGGAVLAMAQARIEELEKKIAQMETRH